MNSLLSFLSLLSELNDYFIFKRLYEYVYIVLYIVYTSRIRTFDTYQYYKANNQLIILHTSTLKSTASRKCLFVCQISKQCYVVMSKRCRKFAIVKLIKHSLNAMQRYKKYSKQTNISFPYICLQSRICNVLNYPPVFINDIQV